jgi:hypothetical protein
VINRALADQPSEDPYSILWRFQSRVNCDGLDQTNEEELVEVLHCLNLCNATESAKVINDLLDFIEMSCSPEGYFDPSLVQKILYLQASSELTTFEKRLRDVFELETPVDRAETLYGEPEE